MALAEELKLEGLSGNPERVAPENESVINPNQRKPETGPENDICETTAVKNEKNDDQQHSSHFIDGNSLSDKTSLDNFS